MSLNLKHLNRNPASLLSLFRSLEGYWEVFHYGMSIETIDGSAGETLSRCLLNVTALDRKNSLLRCYVKDYHGGDGYFDYDDGCIFCNGDMVYFILGRPGDSSIFCCRRPPTRPDIIYGILMGSGGDVAQGSVARHHVRAARGHYVGASKFAMWRLGKARTQKDRERIRSRCSIGLQLRGRDFVKALEAEVGGYFSDCVLMKNCRLREIPLNINNRIPASEIAVRMLERPFTDEDLRAVLAAEHALVPELIHPRIMGRIGHDFRSGRYDTAVHDAFKQVEIETREAVDLPPTVVGKDVFNRAFDIFKDVPNRDMMRNLFSSAYALYRNPPSHINPEFTAEEAGRLLCLASHLLYAIEALKLKCR